MIVFFLLYKKSDAILQFIHKLFHREVRVKEKRKEGELHVEIVSPEGALVEKGVGETGEQKKNSEKRTNGKKEKK